MVNDLEKYARFISHPKDLFILSVGEFLAAANVSISASSSRYPLTAQGSVISGNKTWCAEFDDELQYLEIDLKQSSYVMEIVTQGAVDEEAWIENYTISYGDNGVSWTPYKENSTLKVKCTVSGKDTNKTEKQQHQQENEQTKASQHVKKQQQRNKQCDQILSIVILYNTGKKIKYQIWIITGIFMVFNWVIIGRQIKIPTLEK